MNISKDFKYYCHLPEKIKGMNFLCLFSLQCKLLTTVTVLFLLHLLLLLLQLQQDMGVRQVRKIYQKIYQTLRSYVSEDKYFLGIYLNPKQPLICYYNLLGVLCTLCFVNSKNITKFLSKILNDHCISL